MNYIFYIFPFLLAFLISLGLTPLVRHLAIKNNWAMSKPRERDIHKKPIPRLGGIAIFIAFWTAVFGYLLFNPSKLTFVSDQVLGVDENLLGVFLGTVILLIVGIIDDIKGVGAWQKLFWQIISGIVIVYFGINIWWFANPLGGLNIEIGAWTYLFVPLWIVIIVNVVNWLDGIDGLADGVSVITLIILGIFSATPYVNQPATALICFILAGAASGFLPFNFNPAKIFLGDSGSMFLGFMIAIAAIISGGKVATVALILGIPILDAILVIARRFFAGKSIMQADKYHLHHRFLEAGFSQRQIVVVLYILSALFGVIAILIGTKAKVALSLCLLATMIIIVTGLAILQKKSKNN
jgi:UDP-GlcNAc:undecaprenyl-phosphate GlcNAc-1-phosphate transferase